MSLLREFGVPLPGETYRPRPGGYVIVRNTNGAIAAVRSPEGVFLPGGGQEAGEAPEVAAVREALEECGLVVRLTGTIGVADEYSRLVADGAYVRKRCTFFTAEVLGTGQSTEPDHELVWLDESEAAVVLTHGSQRWALAESRRSGLTRNRSIPDTTVIPVLQYTDVRAAVEWLCRAFGFSERLQIADHRAQLHVGDGAVVAADRVAGDTSPPAAHSVMVRVADANAHCERARAAGAEILDPPTDYMFGERQYTARDPGGHVWTFTQSIADVDPASWGGVLHE